FVSKMKKTRVFLLFATLIALLGGLLLLPRGEKEPVYQGRSLSSWVKQLDDGERAGGFAWRSWRTNLTPEQIEAEDAIRHIGTNALPFLVPKVMKKESPFEGVLTGILGSKRQQEEVWRQNVGRGWLAALALHA